MTFLTPNYLDPNRKVYIVRILREPKNRVTYDKVEYWVAQTMVLNAPLNEPNTASIKIYEIIHTPTYEHTPMYESTCLYCLMGICDKYGTDHT